MDFSTPNLVIAGVLLLVSLVCLVNGWRGLNGGRPEWLADFNGRTSGALLLPWLGATCLGLPLLGWKPSPWPPALSAVLSLAWLCCLLVLLVGLLWYPPFLLPGWYRRARRAGIARNDVDAMAAFKALPKAQQQAAAARR